METRILSDQKLAKSNGSTTRDTVIAFPFHNAPVSPRTRAILQILLLLAVVLRCFFAFQAPLYMDEASGKIHPLNDEYAHLKYTLYLKEHRSFPVNTRMVSLDDPVAWIFQDFEYAQPPLAYIVNLPFVPLFNSMIACRLVAVLLSSITLWLAVETGIRIFRKKDVMALTLMALIGFHPIFVRIGSAVSNDNLTWLLSMILFRLLILDRSLEKIWQWGLWIGLGVLTKVSFLIWIPFLVAWSAFIKTERGLFRRLVMIVLIAGAISGGWLVRNHLIYGDWSGITGGSGPRGEYLASGSPYAIKDFVTSAIRFSMFPIAEETPKYLFVAEAFLMFLVLSVMIQWKGIRAAFERQEVFRQMMIFNVLNLLLFLQANLYWNFSEARLLFAGFFPLAVIASAALVENFRKVAPFAAIILNGAYVLSLW